MASFYLCGSWTKEGCFKHAATSQMSVNGGFSATVELTGHQKPQLVHTRAMR
jgi:hypothetical protein